jgi:long-chain fatty acid transport protein
MHLFEGAGADLRLKFASSLLAIMGLFPALAGAQGIGLPAVGFAAGGTGLTSFYIIGFELGPWQEYLAQELTPSYMLPENAEPMRVSWIRNSEIKIMPDFASHLEPKQDTRINLQFQWQSSTEYLWPGVEPEASFHGTSFDRQYFAPGIEHAFSESGVLGVSAIIAHQRYSAASLGLTAASTRDQNPWISSTFQPQQESGFGTGVRLDLHQEVIEGVAFDAGYQSRIDMEEFAAYRGVYSQAADLDIPARARLGLAFQASERSWLNVAIERVMYSDISAFPSRYLPNRFLSLLGDSTSPDFNWEDLTVYSVGYTWSDGADQQWHVDVSTRTQPSPSSKLLNQALEGDLANSALIVGYSRRTGLRSRLAFNAAYAPSEYAFGGSVLGVTTEELDQQIELEAMWTLSF